MALTPQQETFLADFAQKQMDAMSLQDKAKAKEEALATEKAAYEAKAAAIIAAFDAEVARH